MSDFDLDNTDFPQTPIPEKIPSISRMINSISDITSENPIQEIWKILRFFKDANFCKKYHCQYLGISQENYVQNKSNINKQIEQIGYCIRQAEEYFKASSQVGLATRPNLLYYGAVSLSKALILLRQDGKHSLDWLRNKQKHQHHGLTLKRAFKDTDKVISVKDFFETIQCNCYYQETIDKGTGQKKMIPWGHFPLFYESLAPNSITVKVNLTETDRISQLGRLEVVNASEILPINTFSDKSFNSLEILKTLPDICFQLKQFDIESFLCPGIFSSNFIDNYNTNEEGKRTWLESKHRYTFIINRIPITLKKDFTDLYEKFNKPFGIVEETETSLVYKAEFRINSNEPEYLFEIPDMVDDINGQIFYISKPDKYLPELAAYMILLFNLGMISRYYPDVWLRIIDNNVPIVEITDTLLNIVHRKFPNLILDLMTSNKHYIHP